MNVKPWQERLLEEKEIIHGKQIFEENSKAWVTGYLENDFEYSHNVFGERFLKNRIRVTRLSGDFDFVPIIISEVLLKNYQQGNLKKHSYVEVAGDFRSYNIEVNEGKRHLEVMIFVNFIQNTEPLKHDMNVIYLHGFVCKPTVYRDTPLGRKITDIMLAVNRKYGKSSYIPCISWGRNAMYASCLPVGTELEIYGRIQSRKYLKRSSTDDEILEEKNAYEVSAVILN